MSSKITTRPQPSYQEQVLKNVSDKLLELQILEAQIETEKDLATRVAEFALLLKEQDQPLIDLESALKDVEKVGDFNACKESQKRMWTKINRVINPIASELQKAAAGFITDPKTADLPLEQIIQKIEDFRTRISTYLKRGAISTDLVNAKELLDNYETVLIGGKLQKERPKDTPKDEVRPPIPDTVEQLIPDDLGEQSLGDEFDWMLDDAAAQEGMHFEQVKLPTPVVGSASSSSTTSTTTSDIVVKTDTVSTPEKEFSAARHNTNPLASEQICMQFIGEFARLLKNPNQLNLESIIQLGIEIYRTDKNNFPERLYCLKKESESPACVFEPKSGSYLKLLIDLERNQKGFKGGVIPMIGAVLKFESSSIAIVITQKNKQPQFHIFCPDGNVKLQEKADAFRKEFAKVEDAAEFLLQLHKSMKDVPILGTMHAFIREQDFLLGSKLIKNGPSSSSSSSSTSVSSSSSSIPVPKASINMPAHWHHERTLQDVQSKAFSEKSADLLAAFAQLKQLKAKTGKDQSSIAALALAHLYYVQRLQNDKNINLPNYSMTQTFQNLNGFSSTPEQRYAALNHARADVLLNELEAAYKANDLNAAQQYVLSISTLCQQSSKGPVKESFFLLEAISMWGKPPASQQEILVRIAYIADARISLQQAWEISK